MRMSVPIFCFNESGSIASLAERTDDVLSRICDDYEIIIIDDCSTDGSDRICALLADRMSKVRLVRHPVNKGIGEALRTGYSESVFEYICAIPGDGQFDPSELLNIRPFGTDRFIAF